MRSDRAGRVAVVVWDRLLAGVRFLTVSPSARRRGWRLCSRLAAVAVAVALCAGALVAAPARPALAAAINPVNPGGDLTFSVSDGTVSPTFMTSVVTNYGPSYFGLPTNPTASAMNAAVYKQTQSDDPQTPWAAPPTATGSTFTTSTNPPSVTYTAPAASVPTSNLSAGVQGPLAALLTAAVTSPTWYVTYALCLTAWGLANRQSVDPPGDNAKLICGSAAGMVSGLVGQALSDPIANVLPDPNAWVKTVGAALITFVLSFANANIITPWIQNFFVTAGQTIANAVAAVLAVLLPAWLPNAFALVQQALGNGLGANPANRNLMNAAFALADMPAQVAAGNVGNVPTGTVVTAGSGDCMDAYQAGGNPSVGQIAAINACAVTADQNWTEWSNGTITNGGLCLDDNGDSNAADNAVVNLQACNGGYTQLWYENGVGEIVNGATGSCLDDPGGNTAPGTQLIVFACKGGANQQWAPPGGTAAVTGYGNILSVQSAGNYQLCVMPQTTLANPVGSNVLTNYYQSIGSGCGYPRLWALGSNGTLMANGTNALCMDSNGPATTGPGGEAAYFVQLQSCDGAQSQVWKVVSTYMGPTLQNAGDGLCLNTPSGNLGTTVSMIVASCASLPYPGELWTLPGFSAPRSLLSGGPCDIYLYYGTPCGAAYSMDRAMYAGYDGPLYQVTRASDGTTANIGLLATGGDVNASQQDSFCASTTCTITEIYDQSPDGNNLTIEGVGGEAGADQGANATALKIKIGNNEAYGLDIEPGVGYRDDGPGNAGAVGIATGSAPESMYMVASGTHVNYECCFDFGNVETDNHDHGAGTMDAVNLTTWCGNNNSFPCTGGPWVEADLENGQYTGSGPNTETASSSDFVTAMLSNNGQNTSSGQNSFELQGGNSESGGLTTFYNGVLPSGYSPMAKQGAIVLGTGGDNSNSDVGSFFEGVMTTGYPSDTADAAVQANIVAAGYSGSTNPVATSAAVASAAGPAVVHSAGATGAGASGFSSVYTVDSANGHLQETYLPYMGDSWTTQDLSATGGTLPGTPPVMPGTQPVALVHCGYTSVFTVDAANGDLQETYLPAIGGAWYTQDLSGTGGTLPGTPPTNTTPTAVVHSTGAGAGSAGCDGYTSVYTVDRNGDLQETYLPNQGFPGDSWHTQDLSGTGGFLPGTPGVLPGTAPVAITHCGFTSVYTVDGASDHLQETYLPAIGGAWYTQDLSGTGGTLPGTPPTTTTPTAVVHSAGAGAGSSGCDGYTSVYTVNRGQPGPGGDLPAQPGVPRRLVAYPGPVGDRRQPGGHPAGGAGHGAGGAGAHGLHQRLHRGPGQRPVGGDLPARHRRQLEQAEPVGQLRHAGDRPDPDRAAPPGRAAASLTGPACSRSMSSTVTCRRRTCQTSGSPATRGYPGPVVDRRHHAGHPAGLPAAVVPGELVGGPHRVHEHLHRRCLERAPGGDVPAGDGRPWVSQDLTSEYSAPDAGGALTPVALVHDGYTSVYTVDAASGDLQETYLPGARRHRGVPRTCRRPPAARRCRRARARRGLPRRVRQRLHRR